MESKSGKEHFEWITRELKEDDLLPVQEILEMWVKDRETGELDMPELNEDMDNLRGSLEGRNSKQYFIAEDPEGKVIGIMGYAEPKKEVLPFVKTQKAGELINAYVHEDYQQGKGVGSVLLKKIEDVARSKGCTEVILDSGPRHRITGHPFYLKRGYEIAGTIPDFYGPGGHTTVFRRKI